LNRLFAVVMLFGVIVALGGIALDLVPGANPGISVPQLIVIIAGATISVLGWTLRNPSHRHKLMSISLQNILIIIATVAVMVILLEVLLAMVNTPLRYPDEIEDMTLTPLDYWVCDELGCRYNYEVVQAYCADGRLLDIHCVINEAGFHDTDTFTREAVGDVGGLKIMTLGDSFTFGASAKLGSSWVETIEANMPDSLVWNFGMPGTGNNQAYKLLETYAPQLEPDIVILGFYLNDFSDNVYPLDQFYRGQADNKFAFIRQYTLAPDDTPTRITDPTHLLYRFRGVEPPANRIEAFLGKTHLGSLALNSLDALRRVSMTAQNTQREIDVTRSLLQSIADTTEALDAELLILLIPDSSDITQAGRAYQNALTLFDELNLNIINPIDILDTSDYERQPGVHWLTSGHVAVGNRVSDCLQIYQDSGTWQPCAGLTLAD
jgi:hypothetical protein